MTELRLTVSRAAVVTAADAATVDFRLDKPSALFLSSLARTDCAMTGILHRDSVKADGTFDTLLKKYQLEDLL